MNYVIADTIVTILCYLFLVRVGFVSVRHKDSSYKPCFQLMTLFALPVFLLGVFASIWVFGFTYADTGSILKAMMCVFFITGVAGSIGAAIGMTVYLVFILFGRTASVSTKIFKTRGDKLIDDLLTMQSK